MMLTNLIAVESPSQNNFNFAGERMSRSEAATYLGMSIEFLEVDAFRHKHGIPYIKLGRKVFYIKSDLDNWILSRRV
jgi:hypothetical protein